MMIAGGLLLGLIVGVVYGLTGLNAVILIPALIFFFGMSQHRAQGTTVAMLLLPVGVFTAWRYWKAGAMDLRLAGLLAIGFTVGGLLGGSWAQHLPDVVLRRGFAVVLLCVALRMLFS